ncbi:unnamed protein product [Paramecium pentaurelia]|uniref:Uncharacterized protein n=1 Tax=Paramecium pentaurelia TaxID=43138 RepID=A0A8S1XI32_9CILI|nr:unnamed protein product [Paramecium pentaurelia]
MKKYTEKDFDEKVEKAVDKYLNKKAQQQLQKGYFHHHNECIIDKLVEKEKLMTSIANIFTEVAKITCNKLVEPIKQQIDQLESDLAKIKELVIKSFNQFTPVMRSVGVSEKVIESGKQIEIEEIDRVRKKLQNHDNMISLLMDTQAQLKQTLQIFNNSDDIQQKLLSQFDDKIYQLKQELNDTKVNDTVRQVKEKCNACWVVLGDVNERVEKMQKYLDEQIEKKKSGRGLLQKAASYIKAT